MIADLPIPPGHQLFRVTVEVTATQEKEVLVIAAEAVDARRIARREVHFSMFDFDSPDIDATARITTAEAEDGNDALENEAYIDWPVNSRRQTEYNTRELLDLLLTPDAETAQHLRWRQIESNNGQMPLPLSTSLVPA